MTKNRKSLGKWNAPTHPKKSIYIYIYISHQDFSSHHNQLPTHCLKFRTPSPIPKRVWNPMISVTVFVEHIHPSGFEASKRASHRGADSWNFPMFLQLRHPDGQVTNLQKNPRFWHFPFEVCILMHELHFQEILQLFVGDQFRSAIQKWFLRSKWWSGKTPEDAR